MEVILWIAGIWLFFHLVGKAQSNTERKNQAQVEVLVSYREPSRPKGKPAIWYSAGESVVVKGQEIPGGLLYVGEVLFDKNRYENDACLIDPRLKVAPAKPSDYGDRMGYWPRYANIEPHCRGAYLAWLAGGRKDPAAYIGYVFLFFYGLERRLLVDSQAETIAAEERRAIISEIRRLLDIYGINRSFRGYASRLLAAEWAIFRPDEPAPDYIDFNDRFAADPLRVVVARQVAKGLPIPADTALQWIRSHPEYRLRTPARRCRSEFEILFKRRYKKQFGDGLVVKPNKKRLQLTLSAASPSISYVSLPLPDHLPDPFELKGPANKLGAIADECTDALESYSRYLGKKGSDPASIEALGKLPPELAIEHSAAADIQRELEALTNGGIGLVPASRLYEVLGERPPLKAGKKDCEALASAVETVGFGLVPDVRYYGMKLEVDGPVGIFPKGHGIDFRPSREFRIIATIIRLGAMVAQIDGDTSPEEQKLLLNLVDGNRNLNAIEKDSLRAFVSWSLRTPQGTSGLKKNLESVSVKEKNAISHILLSVAHADGRIEPEEVRKLENLYTTLGLDKSQVTSDLHAMAASSEPVTVKHREPSTSFTIPSAPKSAPSAGTAFNINEELVQIRQEETQQVRGVLDSIFSDDESEAEIPPPPEQTGAAIDALDDAHRTLYRQIISQEEWPRSTFHKLCEELGLMVDGAMEVINEWAFDTVNAPLIDDGDPILVDTGLVEEIESA